MSDVNAFKRSPNEIRCRRRLQFWYFPAGELHMWLSFARLGFIPRTKAHRMVEVVHSMIVAHVHLIRIGTCILELSSGDINFIHIV